MSLPIIAQSSLPRSTPEAQNIDTSLIQQFLDAVESESKHEVHSMMLLRNGKVFAEGWWAPYGPEKVGLRLQIKLSPFFRSRYLQL